MLKVLFQHRFDAVALLPPAQDIGIAEESLGQLALTDP